MFKIQNYVLGVNNVTQVHLLAISSCGFCLQGQIQTNLSQFSLFGGPTPKKLKLWKIGPDLTLETKTAARYGQQVYLGHIVDPQNVILDFKHSTPF